MANTLVPNRDDPPNQFDHVAEFLVESLVGMNAAPPKDAMPQNGIKQTCETGFVGRAASSQLRSLVVAVSVRHELVDGAFGFERFACQRAGVSGQHQRAVVQQN